MKLRISFRAVAVLLVIVTFMSVAGCRNKEPETLDPDELTDQELFDSGQYWALRYRLQDKLKENPDAHELRHLLVKTAIASDSYDVAMKEVLALARAGEPVEDYSEGILAYASKRDQNKLLYHVLDQAVAADPSWIWPRDFALRIALASCQAPDFSAAWAYVPEDNPEQFFTGFGPNELIAFIDEWNLVRTSHGMFVSMPDAILDYIVVLEGGGFVPQNPDTFNKVKLLMLKNCLNQSELTDTVQKYACLGDDLLWNLARQIILNHCLWDGDYPDSSHAALDWFEGRPGLAEAVAEVRSIIREDPQLPLLIDAPLEICVYEYWEWYISPNERYWLYKSETEWIDGEEHRYFWHMYDVNANKSIDLPLTIAPSTPSIHWYPDSSKIAIFSGGKLYIVTSGGDVWEGEGDYRRFYRFLKWEGEKMLWVTREPNDTNYRLEEFNPETEERKLLQSNPLCPELTVAGKIALVRKEDLTISITIDGIEKRYTPPLSCNFSVEGWLYEDKGLILRTDDGDSCVYTFADNSVRWLDMSYCSDFIAAPGGLWVERFGALLYLDTETWKWSGTGMLIGDGGLIQNGYVLTYDSKVYKLTWPFD